MEPTPIIALFGPTAVGKTAIALELAELLRERGEDPVAISADAYAVYREMPIVSGAPSPAEQDRLEHQMVGIVGVSESYSVGTYQQAAHRTIDAALAADRTVILVGGTGLYMQAASTDLVIPPPVPDEVRQRIHSQLDEVGPTALHDELSRLKPAIAAGIAPTDARRVSRALELIRIGHDPAPGADVWNARQRLPTVSIGISRDRRELRLRIESRIESMLDRGAAEEMDRVRRIGPSPTARKVIGFEELTGGDPGRMLTRTRALARRQEAWMRRMGSALRLDATATEARTVAMEALAAAGR